MITTIDNHTTQKRLYILTAGLFCDTFNYFGLLTILVLYLSKVFKLPDAKSDALFGVYITFIYALPVLGGMLADRLFGLRRTIIIGFVFLIAGNLLLIVPQLHIFYFALALTVGGSGLCKPNLTTLIGLLYPPNDPRRERGFTLAYVGINVGGMLGAITYGFLAQTISWQGGFMCSVAGLAATALLFMIYIKPAVLSGKNNFSDWRSLYSNSLINALLLLLILLLSIAFFYPKLFSDFLILFTVVIVILLSVIIAKRLPAERKKIIGLCLLWIFALFFFIGSLQVGSSITFFIDRYVPRVLFDHRIPTTFFTALDPLFVVLSAPIFVVLWSYLRAKKWEPTLPGKLVVSLLLVATAFICLWIAAQTALHTHYFVLLWVVAANFFLGAGEICLAPAILTAISVYSPLDLKSTLMGAWFLFVAIAGNISALLVKSATGSLTNLAPVAGVLIYQKFFLSIAVLIFVVAFLLILAAPRIKKLLA